MKKIFLMCASVLLMASCAHTSGNASADNATVGDSIASTANTVADLSKLSDEQVAKSAQDSLTAIYAKVFAWYNDPANAGEKTPDFESLYMSADYLKLYKEVVTLDDKHPDMVGFFDADHWVCGQDYQNLSMKIVSGSRVGENGYKAELVISNCGSDTPLAVSMIFENGEWKIDDFLSGDKCADSEKIAMQSYVASNSESK